MAPPYALMTSSCSESSIYQVISVSPCCACDSLIPTLMQRSLLLCTLVVLVGLACHADPAAAASAGCRIPKPWSLDVEGRGTRDVYGVLAPPHCLLLSDLWQNGIGAFYALDVVSGRVAWQWPNTTANGSLGVFQQAVDLQPSLDSSDRLYALATYSTAEGTAGDTCAALVALHPATGSPLYTRTFCFPSPMATARIVVTPPVDTHHPERIALAIGGYQLDSYTLIHVLDAASGRVLSTTNVSDVLTYEVAPVNRGRGGYFTTLTAAGQQSQLWQVGVDDRVHLVSPIPRALIGAALRSQPALRCDNPDHPSQLLAANVSTDAQVWASRDPFLVGTDWGRNATYAHYATAYELVESEPDRFLVLNDAFDMDRTVTAAVGLYSLSTGQAIARSTELTFPRLSHPEANPSTWQFGDVLLLRGDTVWYTLQMPSLELLQQGHYATDDAAMQSNNWIVSPDGSYVALIYGDDSRVMGYPPYTDEQVEMNDKPIGGS